MAFSKFSPPALANFKTNTQISFHKHQINKLKQGADLTLNLFFRPQNAHILTYFFMDGCLLKGFSEVFSLTVYIRINCDHNQVSLVYFITFLFWLFMGNQV